MRSRLESDRITADGRPVANLVPIGGARRTFVPRDDLVRLLKQAPLDAGFNEAVERASGSTIDEL